MYTDGITLFTKLMKKILIGIVVVAVVAAGVWFATKGGATAQITVTASYSDQVDLPAGSAVEYVLIDVSESGVDSETLAQKTVITKGEGSPFSFVLEYNPKDINPQGEYSVGARVRVNGNIWWTSTSNTLVITNGHPTEGVEINLVNVR